VAEEWTATGHEVTVLVPRCKGAEADGVESSVRYIRRGSTGTVFFEARRHLRQHDGRYDHVLESVSTRPFFAHRQVGTKATALYHQIADDVWPQEYRFPISTLGRHVIEPWWIRGMRGARVVTVSPSNAADLMARGVAVQGIVPPGVDLPSSIPARSPASPPRCIFIGRLNRTKRVFDAVRTFEMLCQDFAGATLDIVGRGYLQSELERLSLPGLRIHGFVSDEVKSSLLMDADVMLLPGTREGWGIVALEAAAHGVPVVAYDIPGLRDAVVHGRTGLLSSATPAALAAAARRILGDTSLWQRMRSAARERAYDYSWAHTSDRLLGALVADGTPAAVAGRAGAC
jgi:glycosyltransferase involved in cell wall biosynthesis